MNWIDWTLVTGILLAILGIGIYTRRYMRSVADFLSGGRLAGRYLLAVARGEMQAGAVVFVALFEIVSKSGFTMTWWGWLNAPVGLLVGISGFVIYRYRETRAFTLAQFFEIRYSRNFRVFTGILGFVAGIMNFGIIPAVGARFLVSFMGMPPVLFIGHLAIPTYIPLMALFLGITLALTLTGGLITGMVTNCVEGILSQVLYLVLIFGLLHLFDWSQINEVLSHQSAGQSLLNPMDSLGLQDFNLWYVLMSMFVGIYGTMAWQNQSSYNSAALSPHESRMGGILGSWREFGKGAVVTLLAICAVTYLQHPSFASQAVEVQKDLAQIHDPQIQQQMQVPMALSHLLPTGLKGVLCVILLMGIFGGDATHLHSWGGLFIQDVWLPLRKRMLEPAAHIRLLRWSITGVAIFAFLFGCLFRQTEYIVMWFQVTTGLYVGGAGAAIIGGLYWKKGTTAGAWAAMLAGSLLSAGGILARQFYGTAFPLNGMQISFGATLIAIALYVLISLLTYRKDFDMDRMLHRGIHSDKSPMPSDAPSPRRVGIGRLIGFDENFTLRDKLTAGGLFAWGMLWFFVFVIGTAWNLVSPWPESVWSAFWHFAGIGIPIFLSVVTAVWFTWGGLRDIRNLFQRLRREQSNPLDNGMVVNHQNLDDLASSPEPEDSRKANPRP